MNSKLSKIEPIFEHTRHSRNADVSKKDQENIPNAYEIVTGYRSVKIRKDVFELLKLYCLCHKQSPRDVVTSMLETKLEAFRGRLEEIRQGGSQ
ncbi:MAG: hypothetical protein QXK08_03790 [Candidatus Woesearchaeota archaeon]